MLRIVNKKDLHYTKGDTFQINVTAKSGGFAEGSSLSFVIAKNEHSEPVINNSYNLIDNAFTVTLSNTDKQILSIDENYIYKLVLKGLDGTVITQISGILKVNWGA